MAAPQTPRPTPDELWAQLCELPEHLKGEIIDGELYVQPRPRPRHSRAISFFDQRIGSPFDHDANGPGGWWILVEPGIELPNSREVAPDLAGWRRTSMPELDLDEPIRTVPDWVCEIISPSNARHDIAVKQPFYARIGVSWLWLVDTRQETLQVNQLVENKWVIQAVCSREATVRLPPFQAIELPLESLWANPKP